VHIREVVPKDFYFTQILRSQDKGFLLLIDRLILNPSCLDEISASKFRAFVEWTAENLLKESVFSVEDWLELSFHLCKQRWDSSVDWLESQPMSKVKAMIDIVNRFAEAQKKEMSK
jgi:hypothetical protein